jgi:LytS/YehU family sensor histidine kinase
MTYHLFHKNRKQELAFVELRASQIEMELKNLRNQLNPHFLFNALNSIRALIQEDPEKSKEAITRLSGVLRGSLQMGKKSLVTLTEEKQLVEDYLQLEKIRFEERLSYKMEDQTKEDWLIPPFCVQTLAENAIKHGISKLAKGGEVIISFEEIENALNVIVLNTGKLEKTEGDGIGLENVRQRLHFQFCENAYFHIQQKENFVESKIVIKKSYEGISN